MAADLANLPLKGAPPVSVRLAGCDVGFFFFEKDRFRPCVLYSQCLCFFFISDAAIC